MYKLTLENEDEKQIVFNQLGGPYTITDIEGLGPAGAVINTNVTALIDGGTFNSSKVEMRTINLAFVIESDVEVNRLNMYKVIQPKKPITMYYKSELMDVFINGYVESVNVGYFDQKQTVTVSILCPFPFWKNAQEIVNELSAINDLFHFPFASTEEPEIVFGEIDYTTNAVVDNNGTVDTGLTFELYARGTVTNPKIFNYVTQEFIGLNFTFQAGDLVTINTQKGQKSITLLREGVESNLFNSLMKNVTWLQLPSGGAAFVYTIEDGLISNLTVTIKHYDLFEGV